MMTLLDTEQSYVESLRSLIQVTHEFISFHHANKTPVGTNWKSLRRCSDCSFLLSNEAPQELDDCCGASLHNCFNYTHAGKRPHMHTQARGKANTRSGIGGFQM